MTAADNNQSTPLMWAAELGMTRCVERLIQARCCACHTLCTCLGALERKRPFMH